MKTTKKHYIISTATLLLLVILVVGKPLLELYKQFIDPSIELCENLEKENSEEKELEDDLEEKSEKHFLNKKLDSISTTTYYSLSFSYRLQSYLELYLDAPLQPPQQA